MKPVVSSQVLLAIVLVLLAANLVTMLVVNTATPAQAQTGRTCVGVAVAWDLEYKRMMVYRAWSDGHVDQTAANTSAGVVF